MSKEEQLRKYFKVKNTYLLKNCILIKITTNVGLVTAINNKNVIVYLFICYFASKILLFYTFPTKLNLNISKFVVKRLV